MSAALNSLLRQSSIEDHDEILKQCNEALKQNKNDEFAQHIKIVALLKLDRCDDAVRVFDQGVDQLKSRAALEYAYTLYKSGQTTQAKDTAGRIDSRAAKLLQSQISYRLEDFANSAKIYEALAKEPQGEENDIRINLNATYAQLLWKRQGSLVKKTKAEREDLEGFETAYNAACISMARGDLGPAGVLLQRAKDLCNALEELSPEQKQEELLSITVQQLYVLNALGKDEEAQKLAEQISSESIPDESTKHISVINKLAASGQPNPYLARRQLESAPALSPNDRLFEFQGFLARKNDLALEFSSSKLEGIKRRTATQLASTSGPSLDVNVNLASSVNAAAHAQGQLGKQGLKAILPLLEKRPYDIGLIVTIVQLYILSGNNGAAIHVMEKFLKRLDEAKSANKLDVRFNPGLIAILVSLYSVEGRKTYIRDELAKAALFWKTQSNPPLGLLRAAAVSLLERGSSEDVQTAGELFTIVNKVKPEDRVAKAGVYSSSGTSDSTYIDKTSLTPVDRLISNINIAALDQDGIPRSNQSTAAILKRKHVDTSSSKPSKKRIRKSQLPKDYDPNKKPDPERWLPLRDRSTYRPKGRKGKQKQSTATQGSNEKPADGTAVQEKSTVATASSGANKAKKKKSKR